jgi:hypothetical protein
LLLAAPAPNQQYHHTTSSSSFSSIGRLTNTEKEKQIQKRANAKTIHADPNPWGFERP